MVANQSALLARFKSKLVTKRLVPENRVSFYVHWVTQFCCHQPGEKIDSLSDKAIENYLSKIKKTKEPWQVDQAREAISLFLWY